MTETTPARAPREYQRFTRTHRVLHILMILSFMTLAWTGMTLKFSYTGWARFLARAYGGFQAAGTLHRLAAAVMFGIFLAHLYDLIVNVRARFGSFRGLLFNPDTLLPTRKDLQDVRGSFRWFLGKGPRPRYGRWTYWEKFDYFAVFWGMVVIGSTGLLLWFPEFFTRFLPGSLINVATIIHSDEALLAVGFIFTVHFFNTHLRPEKFPMDLVIFTGSMPVEEYREDKPEDYERLVASGELQTRLVDPYPLIVLRAIRVFAWAALGLGLLMVLMIIYAMLFAYR